MTGHSRGNHFTMSSTEATGHRRTQDMPPIAIDPMPPVVDPDLESDTSVGVSEGGRCASGFVRMQLIVLNVKRDLRVWSQQI